ncbi:hypothetical protein JRC04_14600 [Mycolicibacterium sp. S2-37]|uniref:hypothetical protein n=1 Tax=Mycolicibacterium sp. S2-37 TaxID=2810297 RepID=UPI001A94DAAC|nr:hypothetical protein [Mycolicibacterium sp. S2-37]MBO0678696.1 hypothetical protein [Mycolicibacterium sp. S2-37]
MKHIMIGAAAAAWAVAGIALAPPANADLAPGTYTYRSVMADGTVTEYLIRVTDCGPGCIGLFNLTTNNDQGMARVQGNRYVLDQFMPGGATCPDGRPVDVQTRSTFDLDGSNGIYTLNGPNPCGAPGPVGETRFAFTPA